MAEAHPTPTATTGVLPVHGWTMTPALQRDLDELKEGIKDLKTMVGSLIKEIKGLKRIKAEATASGVPRANVGVKTEGKEPTLTVDSRENPALSERDTLDDEPMEVDVEAGNTRNTSDDVLQQSRRQSTEEPRWVTPPGKEILFKVNPEYARRIARAATVVAPPVGVPVPLPQPREETPPLSIVHHSKAIGIIPASQAKRKHNFELIIEIPAKRFKALRYPTPDSSSNGPIASSSRMTLDAPAMMANCAPVKKAQNHPHGKKSTPKPTARKVSSLTFKVNLNPEIRDVTVTRGFISSYFGAAGGDCSRGPFYQVPEDLLNKHGYDHFVFMYRDNTPQPPPAPGKPGLVAFFEGRQWPLLHRYRIFSRVRVMPTRWQYMGLYKATKLPAWTPKEVKDQRATVKGAWSRIVRDANWARPMLARIMLRLEVGREPTGDEVDNQIEKLKEKSVSLPSFGVITAAFENGEEKIYPWKLECDDYEEDLQMEIALVFPHHEKEAVGSKK